MPRPSPLSTLVGFFHCPTPNSARGQVGHQAESSDVSERSCAGVTVPRSAVAFYITHKQPRRFTLNTARLAL